MSNSRIIQGKYVFPKAYKDHICFVEYNNQYFIPDEYIKQGLIIEFYCLPKEAFSQKENLEDKKDNIGRLLGPVNIGYAQINYDDIRGGKFKYPIKNNDIDEPNSFVILNGGSDSLNNFRLKNIQGKDYSIGGDSYIEKTINKELIDNAKNNPELSDEIKNKYFNISFDENDFIFRPNEDMNEDEFFREISNKISEEEIQKIRNNKNYNFLPFCEKFQGEETLLKSKNLKNLSNEQIQYI